MRKPGNIFLLAILVGALAAALVYRQFSALQTRMEQATVTGVGRSTVDVVVATEPIPLGAKIQETQVRVVAWPADLEPEGVLRDPKASIGVTTRASIEKNQPIVQTALLPQGVGLLPTMIEEGMRGMSVRVDEVTGVSGFITPNSRVDVLVAGNPEEGELHGQRSRIVLQNIKVLATGRTIEQKEDKAVEVPTVTLLVTPEEAERLTLATRYEPVRLALRNYRDELMVETPGVSTKKLFKGYDDGDGQGPAATGGPVPYEVDVLLGDKLTRQSVL
jgi:pilus assembly protein CpaB